MHWDTLKQDNYSIVRGDGGSRVGEVRAGTTSPMPEHKGFYATVTVRDPPNHTSSLRVKVFHVTWASLMHCKHTFAGGSSSRACSRVDRALDSRTKGLEFSSVILQNVNRKMCFVQHS